MKKILIVEDQEMLGEEMRKKLNSLLSAFPDAVISVVGTFAAAVKEVGQYPSPDIVLLDLSLPDSTWQNTVAHAHEIDAVSATIIVTGHAEEKIRAVLRNQEIEVIEKTPALLTTNVLIEACARALMRRGREEADKLKANIARMHELLLLNAPTQ